MFLWSHNPLSRGARRLVRELGCRRIKHRNSRFSGHRNPYVINWGATAIDLPWKERVRLLNAPEAVERVSNKAAFFVDMQDEDWIPPFTGSMNEASDWIREGKKVVCRTILNGHGGIGIVIASTVEELVDAPLYVQYIPKKSEYRVHIFKDHDAVAHVFDCQKKVRKRGVEPLDWQIRSHDNGFVYQRGNFVPEECVLLVAIQSMNMTDLHFGAVDVIYNSRQDRAYVLEINTAPGLEGQTVISYADAFKEFTGE